MVPKYDSGSGWKGWNGTVDKTVHTMTPESSILTVNMFYAHNFETNAINETKLQRNACNVSKDAFGVLGSGF